MSSHFMTRAACLTVLLLAPAVTEADDTPRPYSFVNDVVPVLTKASCNSGGCHAKAGLGQNGFRLSLLGFEPQEDYEHIVREGFGRRVFPSAPDESLLLLKATNTVPHGGGRRLDPASADYQTIREWIRQGMTFRNESDPELASIEVQPAEKVIAANGQQQLHVIAHYDDGSQRDVTRLALYEPNNKSMAEVDAGGQVILSDIPGNVAVMVRYQGLVAVFSASIPLGAPVENLPEPVNFIDELVFKRLKTVGIPPSPVCDDATFLRRVTIDIAGRLPTRQEAQQFLSETATDKRDQLIERLLASPGYADYFANKWAPLLHNRRDAASDTTANFAFHSWIRDSLLSNKPYDQFVRELLGATGTVVENPPVAWYKRVQEPERQLEDIAQLFLGVRMQCAQCHHHPFERWSQTDYYSFAAFFSQVGRRPTSTPGEDIIFHERGVAQAINRKTQKPVKPAPLGEEPLEIRPDEDPRLKLANWMSDPENPFFAKALVNRYWKHFFGRGLIEPEDDIRDTNPPSNPELLDALAAHFVNSRYDLKEVVRVMTRSRTYQLSSIPNEHNIVDRQNFSRYYPKPLTAEVFLDAIDDVTGATSSFPDVPAGTSAVALPDNSYNNKSYFLEVFGRPDGASVCECERVQSSNLSQSLHLLNSSEMKQKLSVANGRAARFSAADRSDEQNIDELYLAAFSRSPTAEEMSHALDYLNQHAPAASGETAAKSPARRAAYEDLLWAIMNTKEFRYNH